MSEHLIAERLKELRNIKNVTQDDVAEILRVKRQTYGAYERGVSVPDAITLKKLASYFCVSMDYIAGLQIEDTDESSKQRVALFKGGGEVTDEMWNEVETFAQFVEERERRKREAKGE